MGPPTPAPYIRHCYISEMVEDRWVHAARHLTSIKFSFNPCNIYCDGYRGVGYPAPADARSVGDSHPSCLYRNLNRILVFPNTPSASNDNKMTNKRPRSRHWQNGHIYSYVYSVRKQLKTYLFSGSCSA